MTDFPVHLLDVDLCEWAAPRVQGEDRFDGLTHRPDRGLQTQLGEGLGGVAPQGQPCADLLHCCSSFEDHDLHAGIAQRIGGRQTADACADDDTPHPLSPSMTATAP